MDGCGFEERERVGSERTTLPHRFMGTVILVKAGQTRSVQNASVLLPLPFGERVGALPPSWW